MKRIEMEHIGYVPHVPQPGPHPGTLPFVQIDAERCVGCDTCQEYCPTGAIFGEVGREHAIPHPEACINCGQCLTPVSYTHLDVYKRQVRRLGRPHGGAGQGAADQSSGSLRQRGPGFINRRPAAILPPGGP